MTLFGWTVQVSKAKLFRSTVLTLLFRKFQRNQTSYSTTCLKECRCGSAPMCHKNCRGLEVWMSGSRSQPSFDALFSFIEQEFERRRNGVWFYNNGVPTYITGRHYMFLQWSKIDIGYPSYLAFQREIFLHMAACEADSRCIGQLYTKCRRSGYTNICASVLVDEATQVKDKLPGNPVQDW